jgi:hypothetical protein
MNDGKAANECPLSIWRLGDGSHRYYLGVVILILVPLGLLYWLIIHGWARRWRRWVPIRSYLIVLPVLAALGVLLFQGPWTAFERQFRNELEPDWNRACLILPDDLA